MKKYSMLYLCLFASLSLMSCSQDENMLSENNNDDKEFLVTVDFSVSGIADYGESNQPTTRSAASPVTKVIPLNEDFEAEVTLAPDVPVQTRSAAPTSVANGVCFRVLAYKGDSYRGHVDYQIVDGMVEPLTSTGHLLLNNDRYKFIAYSYNKSDYLPKWNSAWEATGLNLPINAEEHDFLYWTEDVTLDQLNVKLPIVFSHLLPQFKVKLDISELLGLKCNFASAKLDPFVSGGFISTAGTWNPVTHNDNNNEAGFKPNRENHPPTIGFSESELEKSHEYVFSSNPKIMFPITNKGLMLSLTANFGQVDYPGGAAHDPSQTLAIEKLALGQHTFLSGRSYTCLIKIIPTGKNEYNVDKLTNSVLVNTPLTLNGPTNFVTFNILNEGADNKDLLGTALHGTGGMSPAKAVVLWQETDPVDSNIPLISGIRYLKDEKKILMAINGGLEGNALVAAVDVGGDIIWSWHVWVLKNSPYFNNGLTTMNLGATEHNPNGLLYQYGRKDPLRRNAVPLNSTDPYRSGILNPMNFITNWSWETNLWLAGEKRKNDPCPQGSKLASPNDFTLPGSFVSSAVDGYINSSGEFTNSEGVYWTNDPTKVFRPSTGIETTEITPAAYYIRCIHKD